MSVRMFEFSSLTRFIGLREIDESEDLQQQLNLIEENVQKSTWMKEYWQKKPKNENFNLIGNLYVESFIIK